MPEQRPPDHLPRLWIPLLVIAGLAVAVNYLFGSPFTSWMRDAEDVYQPLLGIPLLLILTAVVPIVMLVYLGIRKKR
jgi:hypothetical protein